MREKGDHEAQNTAVDAPVKWEVRGQTRPVNSRQNTEPPQNEAIAARTIMLAGMYFATSYTDVFSYVSSPMQVA